MGFSFVWYLFWWCFGFDFVGFVVGRFAWFGWVCVIVSWFYVYCDYWCGFCLSLYGVVLGGLFVWLFVCCDLYWYWFWDFCVLALGCFLLVLLGRFVGAWISGFGCDIGFGLCGSLGVFGWVCGWAGVWVAPLARGLCCGVLGWVCWLLSGASWIATLVLVLNGFGVLCG